MNDSVAFYMWNPFRERLIKSHEFYVRQAKQRLLSRFENIENEAAGEMDSWLEETKHLFDPDQHDPGDFYEQAYDVGTEFYDLLTEMRDSTHMSVLAGMFHEWDKQLRGWLWREINRWHGGNDLRRKIWSVDFDRLMEFLNALGWRVTDATYFPDLDASRLLVNVFKHGEGASLRTLSERYPNRIQNQLTGDAELGWGVSHHNYASIRVSQGAVDRLSNAIINFWNDVPENTSIAAIEEMPNWFGRAYTKDRQNT